MYIDIMYVCICIYIFTQLTELTKFMKKLSDQACLQISKTTPLKNYLL